MDQFDELKREHQEELETIENSVRKTIEKKNQMIEGLRSQLEDSETEKQHLKNKFEKHRNNLVSALE